MGARSTAWLARSLWALSVAFTAFGVLLMYQNGNLASLFGHSEGIDAAVALAFPTVGVLVASRRPANWVGWIFCAIGFFQGASFLSGQYATYVIGTHTGLPWGIAAGWLGTWTWIPGVALTGTFLLLLFPDGRLPSRRWRPVAWLSFGVTLAAVVLIGTAPWDLIKPGLPAENPFTVEGTRSVVEALAPPLFVAGLAAGLLSAVSLILRFWRARGVERQQIKWFAYAGALSVAAVANPLGGNWTWIPQLLAAVLLPAAAGVAILRYRLYDIDLIINRTLVYGTLTAMLVALYFGGIVVLQRLFVVLTGDRSTLAVVASSLAIAALFAPLRRGVQVFVDKRFYRRKYDAAKTLEAFSARLREETELGTLGEHLMGVVGETMRPSHISLWLRPEDAPRNTQADQP